MKKLPEEALKYPVLTKVSLLKRMGRCEERLCFGRVLYEVLPYPQPGMERVPRYLCREHAMEFLRAFPEAIILE